MNFWIGFLIWVFVGFVSIIVIMVKDKIDGDMDKPGWWLIALGIVAWPLFIAIQFSDEVCNPIISMLTFPFRFLENFMNDIASYFYNLTVEKDEGK